MPHVHPNERGTRNIGCSYSESRASRSGRTFLFAATQVTFWLPDVLMLEQERLYG